MFNANNIITLKCNVFCINFIINVNDVDYHKIKYVKNIFSFVIFIYAVI